MKDYDVIIENHLYEISLGDIYKSKAELYRLLGFDSKKYGKNEREVLDRHIEQYISYESTGSKKKREIIITGIFDRKIPFFDNRRNNAGGNNSKYLDDMSIILGSHILDLFSYKKEDVEGITITNNEIFKLIFPAASDYMLSPILDDKFIIYIYKTILKSTIRNSIEATLNSWLKKGLIHWDFNWVVIHKGRLKDRKLLGNKNGIYTYAANDSDLLFIEEILDSFCKCKGCSRKELWGIKYSKDLYSFLEEEIKKQGYGSVYKEYIIEINDFAEFVGDVPSEKEDVDNAVCSIKNKFSNRMFEAIYLTERKKYSKGTLETLKLTNPELYEIFGDYYENEKYIIFDDCFDDIEEAEKFHYSLFGKYMHIIPYRSEKQ